MLPRHTAIARMQHECRMLNVECRALRAIHSKKMTITDGEAVGASRAPSKTGPRRGPTSSCWSEIADFAKYKREFFEKYIDLSNDLPTDDTLRRFFQNLKSFRIRFAEWASSIVHDSARGKVVKAKRPTAISWLIRAAAVGAHLDKPKKNATTNRSTDRFRRLLPGLLLLHTTGFANACRF